jgi:hypothetical protein
MNESSSKCTLWSPPPTFIQVTVSPCVIVTFDSTKVFIAVAFTVWLAPKAAGHQRASPDSAATANIHAPLNTVRTHRRRPAGNLLRRPVRTGQKSLPALASGVTLELLSAWPSTGDRIDTAPQFVRVAKERIPLLLNRRKVSLIALGATIAMLALVSQTASATHVRPKGATPLRASFVPSYEACTSPNRTHAAPIAFPCCNPPKQESNFLTVGSPDANGAGANSQAFLLMSVKSTAPEDILIKAEVTDIRCLPSTSSTVCNGANAASGPDYSGQLQGDMLVRISDHYNGPTLSQAATVQDTSYPSIIIPCANTAATNIGARCAIDTTANAIVPGSVKDGQREVVEIDELKLNDGGADGLAGTAPNTVFALPGVFIP